MKEYQIDGALYEVEGEHREYIDGFRVGSYKSRFEAMAACAALATVADHIQQTINEAGPDGAPRKKEPIEAQGDAVIFDWAVDASNGAGDFLKSLARAALFADHENYAILRPVLLRMKLKYPDYGMPRPGTR